MKPNRLAASPRLLALVPLAVGINLAMGKFASAVALPVFLDTIGTVLVAALVGLGPALITGVVSQTALTLLDGKIMWMAFLPVQLAVAGYAAWAARRALFASTPRAMAGGAILGVLAATLSWPIAYFVFGGVTAGGVTVVTTVLVGLDVPLAWAVFAASVSNDLLDKTATFLLVRAVLVGLPRTMAARFPAGARALGRA